MTGEMCAADCTREVYPLHFAIAKALKGKVRPFDLYQGPYVAVGPDIRIGAEPYAYCPSHLGIVRLWVCPAPEGFEGAQAIVYNEANEKASKPFWAYGPSATRRACRAAREVLD